MRRMAQLLKPTCPSQALALCVLSGVWLQFLALHGFLLPKNFSTCAFGKFSCLFHPLLLSKQLFLYVWALVLLVHVLLPAHNCIHLDQFPTCLLEVQELSFECDIEVTPLTRLLPMLIADVSINKVLIWFWDETKNHTHTRSRTLCQLR